jgi:hypothetical protein
MPGAEDQNVLGPFPIHSTIADGCRGCRNTGMAKEESDAIFHIFSWMASDLSAVLIVS